MKRLKLPGGKEWICSELKINGDISEDLLNMKLTDMFCKHVIRRNPDGIQIKAGKLYIESCKLGYKVCNWGLHVGHAGDIQYRISSILQMERDEYNPAVRIVICKYDFCDTSIVWVDNLHPAIKHIREYGKDVKLRDIPFYVVDISDYEHPSIHGYNGSLREKHEDILGAVSCAYKRFRRSNSKELIEIGYTLKDFLRDNPMLYTELNTHLGLINTSDAGRQEWEVLLANANIKFDDNQMEEIRKGFENGVTVEQMKQVLSIVDERPSVSKKLDSMNHAPCTTTDSQNRDETIK